MWSNSIDLKRREKYYTFLKGIKNQVEFQKNFDPIVIIISNVDNIISLCWNSLV